jgi:hypothetical protein
MVEGRLAGLSVAHTQGLVPNDDYRRLHDQYCSRLGDLRAGEVGEKICMGIMQAMVHQWEMPREAQR